MPRGERIAKPAERATRLAGLASLAPVERSPPMPSPVDLRSVDLSAFPDLVVIYLGMRVRALAGIKTLLVLGPQIDKAGAGRPTGLMHFEDNIIYRLFPLPVRMRWLWNF